MNDLMKVFSALQELGNEKFMLVGGQALPFLTTDAAAAPPRPTVDVDVTCVVERLVDYYNILTPKLRKAGFVESGESICSWRYLGVPVDIIPAGREVLGFSSQWYETALKYPLEVVVGDLSIPVISAPYFIATKFEAFESRGNRDIAASHDLEDIVFVFDTRESVVEEILVAEKTLRSFVRGEIRNVLADEDFANYLPGLVVDEGRDRVVRARMVQATQ